MYIILAKRDFFSQDFKLLHLYFIIQMLSLRIYLGKVLRFKSDANDFTAS